jgi:hypothetical protein
MLNSRKTTVILGAAVLALASIGAAFGQTYYGSQLMSPQERAEHRAKMRSLPPSEREAYRAEHHEEMKKRAESMGLSLPDEPPVYGRGYGRRGPGYGYGRGRPGYWGSDYGYGRGGPGYWGPRYGGWGDRGGYGPGYGDWGFPAW